MLPEQLNSLLLVLIVSCSFKPVGPVISKIKVFLATRCLISVIQYTSDLLLEKGSRTHMIREFWKTSNHCFCDGKVQAAQGRAGATAVRRTDRRGGWVKHHAEGRPQHPVAGEHGEWWPQQLCHGASSLAGEVAKGTKAVLHRQELGLVRQRWDRGRVLGAHRRKAAWHRVLCGGHCRKTGGAKHSLKLWFINWLCTLSKLTLEAYGK